MYVIKEINESNALIRISDVSVDVNFMVGNVTGDNNGRMTSVCVSVKNQ